MEDCDRSDSARSDYQLDDDSVLGMTRGGGVEA